MSPEYRIYPTLLDRFQALLDFEEEAEQRWNLVSEAAHERGEHLDKEVGDYILTPDEIAAKLEIELIDIVNRCDYGEPLPAADRGTCLNEIVDCMVMGVPSTRGDIAVERLRDDQGQTYGLRGTMNGTDFDFNINLCRELRDYFRGSVCQYMTKAPIITSLGTVELYGYIDYWLHDRVIDLKTTSYYEFGKYGKKWQRHIYPYCLLKSGAADEISEMEFAVVKLTGGNSRTPLIGGAFYPERYTYIHDVSAAAIRGICERFIAWLGTVEAAIDDRRIYNEPAVDGYVGVPIALHEPFRDERLDYLRTFALKYGNFTK